MKTFSNQIIHKNIFSKNQKPKTKDLAGFTIVEIITTIAIIAVISILGFTYANNYKLTQYNTVRASDIDILNNTMQTYYETHNKYPLPAGNKQYFDEYGVYTHSATGAYGVSGFITSETFGKEFMLVTQKDPTTKYYYAYSRTLDNKPSFQFATSLNQQGAFYGYVKGTYSDNNLAGIVREYNGPNFVINNNARYLPYNPNELKLTGNIISYSGGVQILKDSNVVDISAELEQGFQVRTDTGALATINLSDGSELRLGSTIRSSVLDFKDLTYKQDDNLLTKISLKLSLGEVWVKAPQLEQGSEFSLETDNAAASVRGTVFGMTTNGDDETTISLIEGKLEIFALDRDGGHLLTFPGIAMGSTGAISSTRGMGSATTIMSVPEGGDPVYLNYKENESNINSSTSTTGTGSNSFTTSTPTQIMQPQIRIKSSYIPKILSFEKTTSTGSLKISNIGANSYKLKYLTGGVNSTSYILPIIEGNIDANSDNAILYLTGLSSINALSFQICDSNTNILIPRIEDENGNVSAGFSLDDSENKCSAWKTIGFDDKPVAVTEESLQKAEILKQQAEGCPEGQDPSSMTNQCENTGLVAFAGYDKIGDVLMNIGNDKTLSTNTDNIVTDKVPYNLTSVSLKSDARTNLQNNNGFGKLHRIPEYIPSKQVFTTATGFYINSNQGGFISYNKNYSYFELPSNNIFPNGGIFIDQKPSGTNSDILDYLKYDLSPLQLGNNFTIEMSVRGAALKRISGYYYLLGFSDGGNTFNMNSLGFGMKNGGFGVNSNSTFTYTSIINNSILSGNILSTSDFYKLRFDINKSQNSLKISLNGQDLSGGYITINNFSTQFQNSKFLNIGGPNHNQYQWNDIIDYIKIYKLD